MRNLDGNFYSHPRNLSAVVLPFSCDKVLNDSHIYLRSVPGTKGVQENYLFRKICPKKPRPFTDELKNLKTLKVCKIITIYVSVLMIILIN